MRTRIVVRALADAQFAEAYNRLNLARSGRGNEFLLTVDAQLEHVAAFPFSFQVTFDDVRKTKVPNFSYLLLYRVYEDEDERRILVLACVHERSDPQTWRKMSD